MPKISSLAVNLLWLEQILVDCQLIIFIPTVFLNVFVKEENVFNCVKSKYKKEGYCCYEAYLHAWEYWIYISNIYLNSVI